MVTKVSDFGYSNNTYEASQASTVSSDNAPNKLTGSAGIMRSPMQVGLPQEVIASIGTIPGLTRPEAHFSGVPATQTSAPQQAQAAEEKKPAGGDKVTVGDGDDAWTAKGLRDAIKEEHPDANVSWKEASEFAKIANKEQWDTSEVFEAITEERAAKAEEREKPEKE